MLAWIKLMCLERFSKPSPNTVLAIRNKHPQSSTIDYMSVYELVTPRCSPLLCWLISSPVSCTAALLHCCTAALLHSTLLHVLLLCVDIKMCVQNTDIHCIGRLVVIFSLFLFTLCHRILLYFNEECRWFCSETFLPSPDIDTESVMRWLTWLSWLLGSGTISGSLRLHLSDK